MRDSARAKRANTDTFVEHVEKVVRHVEVPSVDGDTGFAQRNDEVLDDIPVALADVLQRVPRWQSGSDS
jgi:2-methylisocitrate lyase-like PEP mutase family enzyme